MDNPKIPDLQRDVIVEIARSFLNTPYEWGGDDFEGLDCSGLVVECLKAAGLMKLDDNWADGFYDRFKKNGIADFAQPGDLIFWLDSNGRAYHVAIAINWHFCITADGGGSKTITKEDAAKQNAFIKIRPINHRKSLPKIVNLFKLDI